MTTALDQPRRSGAWFLLVGLVIVTTGRALDNGFAFDDVPIVLENAQIHSLAAPWTYAQQSYWPPKNLGDAYRPWTVWWLAIQWALGGGAPWVFHLGNLLLTVAVTLLVWRLLADRFSPFAAVTGAALFAVHPVHVEATANVVGQGELWMALFVVAAATWYQKARLAGPLSAGQRIGLAALLLLAAGAKEQGIVLPALLLAIEWTLPGSMPRRQRLREILPLYLLLAVVGVAFLIGRYAVLGDMGGGPPAAGLEGLGLLGRTRVMLPLAVDWARLLVWPRDLVAQYSPPQFGGGGPLGLRDVAGAIVLIALTVAASLRRAAPGLALGALWIGVAILPVSNLLFPTGILVAERTLFLPSVGVAIVAAAAADRLARRWLVATSAGVIALVAAGAARSWSRQPVWLDNPTLFAQTIADAPSSYRGFLVRAKELVRRSNPDEAARMYRRAAELYQGDPRVYEEWGQVHRAAGRCDLAVPILDEGVRRHPKETVLRSRLFECLLAVADTSRAIAVAKAGLDLGMTEFTEPLARATRAPAGPPGPPTATPRTAR